MRLPILLFAVVAALAHGASLALSDPPAARAEASKEWQPGDLDTDTSRVYIVVKKRRLGHDHAIVGRMREGQLPIAENQATGKIVFDMKSFWADSDAARAYLKFTGTTDAATQQAVTDNMLGADVLNVAEFPTAEFAIKNVSAVAEKSRLGKPQKRLDGDFTLHGVTKPIQVLAEVEEKDGWLHLLGKFSIQQSDFGIKPYSAGLGAVGIQNTLEITGDLRIAMERKAREEVPSAASKAGEKSP
jgi:polyisoprenoid-binding protein YceI